MDWNLQARRNKFHQVVYKHFQTFLENVPKNTEFHVIAKVNPEKWIIEFAIQVDGKEVRKKFPLP